MAVASLRRSTQPAAARDRPRVAVLIDPADPFARGCMAGVSKWIRLHPEWTVVVDAVPGAGVTRSRLPPPDGAVSWLPPETVPRPWRRGDRPLVFVAASPHAIRPPCVAGNDDAALRLALDHLVDRGARHLGYVPSTDTWEDRRIGVLRDRIGRRGPALDVLAAGATAARITAWLTALPKPLGLVAGSDSLGLNVLAACRDAGIRVPDDVAVIGIGDDACLCDLAVPALSSVAHNLACIGHEACRLLGDLLAGRSLNRTLLVPPVGVVVRRSSDSVAVESQVVRRALQAIRGPAAEGLTPETLAAHVGLPRRTLDHEFRKHLGRTVHEELVRTRLTRARTLLAETDLKLLAVAVRSGFRDASQLCHSFKETFGVSPMDYRRQVRPWEGPPSA